MVKNSPANAGDSGQISRSRRCPGEMATYSSVLVWEIPWTEEPRGLHTAHGVAKSQTRGSTHACSQELNILSNL